MSYEVDSIAKLNAMKGTSIYTYLAWIVFMVVFLIVTIHATNTYLTTKKVMVSDIIETSETVAQTLQKNSADYIESYAANDYLNLMMHEMEAYPAIQSITIQDFNMAKVLGRESFVSAVGRAEDGSVIRLEHTEELAIHSDEHCFHFIEKDIYSVMGELIGIIRICSSDHLLNQQLQATIIDNVAYALATSLTLFILMFFLIRRVILLPVSELVSRLEKQNLGEERVPVQGAREIRALSNSINEMVGRVQGNEARVLALIKNIHTSIVVHDASSKIIMCNPLAEETLRVEEDGLTGKTASDPIWYFVDTKLQRLPVEKYPVSQVIATGKPVRDMIAGICKPNQQGDCTWVLVNAEPVFEEGVLDTIIVSFNDITPLREAEKMVQTLSESMVHAVEGIVIVDRKGVVEYVNPSFLGMTGYSESSVLNRRYDEVIETVEDSSELWGNIAKEMQMRSELTLVRTGGQQLPVMLSSAPVRSPDGEVSNYVIVHTDMTEYKDLENRYIQSQKMEALGTLVGGIAHDFNNMLNGILNTLYLVKRNPHFHPDLEERIDTVSNISMQAANLVKGLLAFARKEQVEMVPLPVVPFIKETLKMHRMAVPENIVLSPWVEESTAAVLADASRLQQVFLNLLNNSVYALKDQPKPEIEIKVSSFQPDDQFKRQHVEISANKMVHITISDNGSGIPEDNLEHAFEPFYTTKPVGEGTGLGLAIVYGVIQAHHGVVEIESREGEGTSVHLYLPVVGGETVESAADQVEREAANNETILLADDNELLRTTLADSFETLGYNVIQAVDGQQALELFKAHQRSIQVLISDVIMPVMGGIEAGRAIRELNPGLPIIFITGYHTEDMDDGLFSADKVMKVGKPVNPSILSQMVHQMLEKPKRI